MPKKKTKIPEPVSEFKKRVSAALGHNLVEMKLYGSYARGDFTKDSDIDILVTVRNFNPEDEKKIWSEALEINLDYDVFITAIVMADSEFHSEKWRVLPFIKNVEREGMVL